MVASDGTVPALEKLDYFPEGNNLNLVFHVIPGQRFEPAKITPKYQGGSFNLVFVIGVSNLNALGGVYNNNSQIFSGVTMVNVDNDPANSQFGSINLVDPEAGTLSEMVLNLVKYLNIPMDQDIASNILNGIYSATSNLTTNVKPGTFMAVGQAMQAGGKLISEGGMSSQPSAVSSQTPIQPQLQVQPQPQVQPEPQIQPQLQPQPEAQSTPLNQIFGFPVQAEDQPSIVTPQTVDSTQVAPPPAPSAEERPMGEQVYSSSPEVQNPDPDWLTPKVYKGGNLG